MVDHFEKCPMFISFSFPRAPRALVPQCSLGARRQDPSAGCHRVFSLATFFENLDQNPKVSFVFGGQMLGARHLTLHRV